MKRQLTENDVILSFLPLTKAVCAHCGRSLDPEDRMQVALTGLLHAIRTYRNMHGTFADYAAECIRQYIEMAEREARNTRRAEAPLSLDMKVSYDGESHFTYSDIFAVREDDHTQFELLDSLQAAPAAQKAIATLFLCGYSHIEIQDMTNIPTHTLTACCSSLAAYVS